MARTRRPRRALQQQIVFRTHGGRRRGAGRKPKGARPGVPHGTREPLTGREPVLVTLKVRPEIWNLRARRAFTGVVRSLAAARERFGVRITQFSVQRDHVHLVVEPDGRTELARAMQGLSVRIARTLNRAMRRKGTVFADRYHGRVLRTPRQVRHALAYVLCNGRKHGVVAPGERFDPCSSAAAFDGWRAEIALDPSASILARVVARPRTWLLTIGWRRGGPLDPEHHPGPLSGRSAPSSPSSPSSPRSRRDRAGRLA